MTNDQASEWLAKEWQRVLRDPEIGDPDPVVDAMFASGPKTLRYVALTQLLGKIADPERDILTVQAGDTDSSGPWDARSFCHKVIVPWEKSEVEQFLGGSAEPYANNPIRVPRLHRDRTDARDPGAWRDLHDLLAPLQDAPQSSRIKEFRRFLGYARRQLEDMRLTTFPVPKRISLSDTIRLMDAFLAQKSGGVRALVLAAAMFRELGRCFGLVSEVRVQQVNEADAAHDALGDITCLDPEGNVVLVVEVKDQPLTLHHLQVAIEKVRSPRAGKASLVFAAPRVAPAERAAVATRIEQEHVAGTDVHVVSLQTLAEAAFVLLPADARPQFLRSVGGWLEELADYVHRKAWRDLLVSPTFGSTTEQ